MIPFVQQRHSERRIDPKFAQAWQEIEESLLDTLEELQFKSALERPEDRRWVLARKRPETWSERKQTVVSGHLTVGVNVRDLTDAELEAIIARGRAPVDADYTVDGGSEEGQGGH